MRWMKPTLAPRGLAVAALTTMLAAAPAPERYTVHLGPTPLNDATRVKIRGRATATATLAGSQLTVAGSFSGLVGPATGAELRLGGGVGIPGPSIAPLKVSAATGGELSGQVPLDPGQIDALRHGRLYVQIDSQAAPDGNLWGWFLSPSVALGSTLGQPRAAPHQHPQAGKQ